MLRERRLNSPTWTNNSVVQVELPKDAVYNQIQLEVDGNVSIAYPASGAAMGTTFANGFPFNLVSRIRLIRNGSDVVWQGSGKQLAAESAFLNGRFPFSRIWVDGTNHGGGTANSILTSTYRGITIPANSEGIGCNVAAFTDSGGATGAQTNQINFRCVFEMWLQLGVEDKFFTTLLDARSLASYVLEITWENTTNVYIVTGSGTQTYTWTVAASVQSYDQDNVALGIPFGTFKRASLQVPGIAFGSSNTQALLPRGNLYYGILLETLATRSAGGQLAGTIAEPGNDIVTEIQNRINSNYLLRDVYFRDLQAKNRNDGPLPSSPYDSTGCGKMGWAAIYYPCADDSIKSLVGTYTMDQFDLLLSTGSTSGAVGASGAASEGYTYSGSPIVNVLTQEVIPGKSVSASSAQGAYAGSINATTANPGT